MKPSTIQLAGKPIQVRVSARPLKASYGYMKDDEIVLSKGLNEHERLDTFLHESLHHLFYFLDEDVVKAAATELADALETLELA